MDRHAPHRQVMDRQAMDRQALLVIAREIRLLVLDVDGVLTDGRLHYDAHGRESKSFHVRDGHGLVRLQAAGVIVAVISGRRSSAAAARLEELRVPHVVLGRNDKRAVYEELLGRLGVQPSEVACVGDDAPDVEIMGLSRLAITVADAHPEAHAVAHWCTVAAGGHGAVREVCDLLLEARQAPSP